MPPHRASDSHFSRHLRKLLRQRGMSFRALAARTYYSKSYLHDLASGKTTPTPAAAARIDEALAADGELTVLASGISLQPDDELEAVELSRRVAASDVSAETLTQLEQAFDELAMSYTSTRPEDLLPRLRRYLGYVSRLVDVRKTLDQHRRLLVVGGWLSLLAATVHIDLRQQSAAYARLATAADVARHAEHREIQAWCLETQAWDVLTGGQFEQAVDLSRQAQIVAPNGTSAHIQAVAQEGRARARMRQRVETRDALDRVARLVSSLSAAERPEHHYRYDPDKALSYTATTLAWAGDPAAEDYARSVIEQLEAAGNRPRRVASARLDLGLALLATCKPDEAAAVAIAAITSGRVVASNWWRATELLTGVTRLGIREATDLRDAYEQHRPPPALE